MGVAAPSAGRGPDRDRDRDGVPVRVLPVRRDVRRLAVPAHRARSFSAPRTADVLAGRPGRCARDGGSTGRDCGHHRSGGADARASSAGPGPRECIGAPADGPGHRPAHPRPGARPAALARLVGGDHRRAVARGGRSTLWSRTALLGRLPLGRVREPAGVRCGRVRPRVGPGRGTPHLVQAQLHRYRSDGPGLLERAAQDGSGRRVSRRRAAHAPGLAPVRLGLYGLRRGGDPDPHHRHQGLHGDGTVRARCLPDRRCGRGLPGHYQAAMVAPGGARGERGSAGRADDAVRKGDRGLVTASPELEREHFALLSIFFPMWNEEAYIHRAVRAAKEICARLVADGEIGDYEIIVVDDASTDATGRLADELAAADPHVRAVRVLRTYEADVVSAYRFDRTGEGPRRAVYSWAYNFLIQAMFGIRLRDINFAFKLCRRRVLDHITLSSEGSFIDAELIIRAKRSGFEIVQIGVDYFPRTRGVSTLSSFAVIRTMVREMMALRKDLRSLTAVAHT